MKDLSAQDALRIAAKLNLISDEDENLVNEVLNRGFELSERADGWVVQIGARIAELERSLQQNSYHRYLNGGPKPATSTGRPDWRAKERYEVVQRSVSELLDLKSHIEIRLGEGALARPAEALKAALSFAKTLQGLRQTKVDSSQAAAEPSANDIRLCLAWANKRVVAQHLDPEDLIAALGVYEGNRLLSARIAELTAAKYYEALGYVVLDVSVGQLGNSDGRWRTHDLIVDGRPIDVKNARRSFSSHDYYVEHCVPEFKQSRPLGMEVSIAGVLSNYRAAGNLAETYNSCRILGEVTASSIRKLHGWTQNRFGGFLDISGIWKPEYQPGWVFEYPPEHYPGRERAIASIPTLIKQLKAGGNSGNQIPSWLLPLCPDRGLALSLAGSDIKRKILNDLYSVDDQIGFSRPALFIYVMGLFLESISNGEQAGQLSGPLTELFFVPDLPGLRPLGLEDSQNYISNLIGMLAQVQDELQRQNIQLTAFSLRHPSILRGKRESGSSMTLLAYCGGWREVPVRARCGNTPLFFGKHEVCPSCGFLVCDICGHCSSGCKLIARRQRDVALSQRLCEEGVL